MKQKGARLGPVLAFLVTTPATSVSALMACWKLMGGFYTVYIFFTVIIMGLVTGIVGNMVKAPVRSAAPLDKDCCHAANQSILLSKNLFARVEGVFRYAFMTLPKEIGFELLLGLMVASFIMTFHPAQVVIREYLSGVWGYMFSLVSGLITYVCSTASVPMADAFLKNGMSYGATMVYLLAGPITSYGVIFAVKKEFGGKILGLYLLLISFLSLIAGAVFNLLMTGTLFY